METKLTKLVNGWSQEEIELLCKRTGCSEDRVIHFCNAVDKFLYLMLPTETKRATLHFHLEGETPEKETLTKSTKKAAKQKTSVSKSRKSN